MSSVASSTNNHPSPANTSPAPERQPHRGPGRPRATSLPYVPIDPRIDTHPRTEELICKLSGRSPIPDDYLVEVPQKIIKWCGAHANGGRLGHVSDGVLARICRWDGEAAYLRQALLDTGWLEYGPDGYSVHDWADYGGRVDAERERWRKNKERQRSRREPPPVKSASPELSSRIPQLSLPEVEVEGEVEGKDRQIDQTQPPPPQQRPQPPGQTVSQDNYTHRATQAGPTVADLEAMADYEPLAAGQVEAILLSAGHIPHVGMGARGMARIPALCPILAHELRHALPQAKGKAAPVGYIASIIANGRREGRQPPPRALPPQHQDTPSAAAGGRTVGSRKQALRQAWAEAVRLAEMPQADSERLDKLALVGEPQGEDIELLKQGQGSWDAYDALVWQRRREALAMVDQLLNKQTAENHPAN